MKPQASTVWISRLCLLIITGTVGLFIEYVYFYFNTFRTLVETLRGVRILLLHRRGVRH